MDAKRIAEERAAILLDACREARLLLSGAVKPTYNYQQCQRVLIEAHAMLDVAVKKVLKDCV